MQPTASRALAALWSEKFRPLRSLEVPRIRSSLPELCAGERIAERLLALLTSSAVRKGSLEQMQFRSCRPELLRAIERRVRAGKPVQLTLMAFPFKAPNPAKVGPRRLPDLAELAAVVRLHQLHLQAKSVYPPGLEIHVIHDGSYIAAVFGVTLEEVRAYESYFARLADALAPERFIYIHDFQALARTGIGRQRPDVSRARESLRHWRRTAHENGEWAHCFRKTLGMVNLRGVTLQEACHLLDQAEKGRLSPEYGEVERRVRVAMLRYFLRDRLLHAFDPRPRCFPDAIHATTQCRPRRLAIWMVDRGRSLLPWHGVGAIDRTGRWRVALAREVLRNPSYRPVFLEGEDTPFFYREVG